MQAALRQSKLSQVEREVVGLTVSWENSGAYAMAAHSTFAQRAGAGDEVLSALRSGDDIPDARLQALQEFTRTLLRERGHVDDDGIAALLEAGYSKEQLLEVITQVAYTTLAHLVANVAETPVDKAFEPQAWTVRGRLTTLS
jgi:alkylhydroperoxidase family enzyme